MAYVILLLLIIILLAKLPIKVVVKSLLGLFSGSCKLATLLFTTTLPLWIAAVVLIRLSLKLI